MLPILALGLFGHLGDIAIGDDLEIKLPDPPKTCASAPPGAAPQTDYHGSAINPTGNLIGGGHGYSESGWPQTGDAIVENISDLRWALAVAATTKGPDRIWLSPEGDFRLWVGAPSLEIPDDTTIFSNRGWSAPGLPDGALVHVEPGFEGNLFVAGDRVRVRGLRLGGPSTSTDKVVPANAIYHGASTYDPPSPGGLEVDNCELFGWTVAIGVSNRTGAHAHHNYFHENQRESLGYGVVFSYGGQGRVIANLFDRNRHAIAADGRDTAYEAAWNTVQARGTSHAFDVHGRGDRCNDPDEQKNDPDCFPGATGSDAGLWVYIHHNTFLYDDDPAVKIRGVVRECAWIDHNHFAHSEAGDAVGLRYVSTLTEAHVRSADNRANWNGLLWSAGGARDWDAMVPTAYHAASGVLYGDFDGDGRDDLFRIDGNGHWWFRLSLYPAAGLPGADGWFDMGVRAAGARLDKVAIGDFDANGSADVFLADGSRWAYFQYGYGTKVDLGAHPETRAALGFGRFDADGKTDVFKSSGGRWWFSSGGVTGWSPLASSGYGVSSLRFGDFVGDSRTDVFRTTNNTWWVSDAGRGGWTAINSSSQGLGDLRFHDMDGDGRTDVFTAMGAWGPWLNTWRYSASGATTWITLGESRHDLDELGFADVDGDGRMDPVYAGDP